MPTPRLDCHRCVHYFITWDENFPHGCRCMGFKSRRFPGEEVRQAMNGQDCRLFEPKSLPQSIQRFFSTSKKKNPVRGGA